MRRILLLVLLPLLFTANSWAGPELLFLAATKTVVPTQHYDITTFEGTNPGGGDPNWYGWLANPSGTTYLVANPTGGQALAIDGTPDALTSGGIWRQLKAVNGTLSLDAMDNGDAGSVVVLEIRRSTDNAHMYGITTTLTTSMTTYNIPITGLTDGTIYDIYFTSNYTDYDGCVVDNIKIPISATPYP